MKRPWIKYGAAQMYFDDLNAAGGVDGVHIQLDVKRLIAPPAPTESAAGTDTPMDIRDPQQEANAIQRGLASWYLPAQIPPCGSLKP